MASQPKSAMPMMATTVGIPMLAIKPMTVRSIVCSVRVSGVPVVTVILPFLSIQAAHTRCSMRIRSRRHQGTSVKSSLPPLCATRSGRLSIGLSRLPERPLSLLTWLGSDGKLMRCNLLKALVWHSTPGLSTLATRRRGTEA